MSLVSVPLPNLQEDRNLVLERVLLNGVSNEHTRRAYSRPLEKFLAWYDARGYAELCRCSTTTGRCRKTRAPRPPPPMLNWRRYHTLVLCC
jgi:predicted phosphoadenosine phosphosulfate sulfurtransferase